MRDNWIVESGQWTVKRTNEAFNFEIWYLCNLGRKIIFFCGIFLYDVNGRSQYKSVNFIESMPQGRPWIIHFNKRKTLNSPRPTRCLINQFKSQTQGDHQHTYQSHLHTQRKPLEKILRKQQSQKNSPILWLGWIRSWDRNSNEFRQGPFKRRHGLIKSYEPMNEGLGCSYPDLH
jgi:hypothetical protein